MDRRKFVRVAGSGIATGAFTEAVVTAQVAAKPPRQPGEPPRQVGVIHFLRRHRLRERRQRSGPRRSSRPSQTPARRERSG